MLMTRADLWRHLAAAGLVEGELPATVDMSPWYVRLMLGVAGWIGAMFLLGFLGAAMAIVFRNESAALTVGVLLCLAAWFIFKSARNNDFLSQFGLAIYFAGQVLLCYGLLHKFRGLDSGALLVITACEVVLAVCLDNAIQRVVSACAAGLALATMFALHGALSLVPPLICGVLAYLWLQEFSLARWGRVVRHCGYGLVLAVISVNSGTLLREFFWLPGLSHHRDSVLWSVPWWLGPTLGGGVFIASIVVLLRRAEADWSQRGVRLLLAAALALVLTSCKAPGVVPGVLVVLLGYAHANRLLAGLGILSLIIYLSHFYYQLQTTLLVKSGALIATGMLLLTIRFLLRRYGMATWDGEVRHA